VAQVICQVAGRADRRRNRGLDELRITHRRKVDEPRPIVERGQDLGSRFERQTRLTDSPWAGDGDEAAAFDLEHPHEIHELALSSHELCGRQEQVRLVQALEGREPLVSHLVEPYFADVLEPVRPQVASGN
jgi:hypothetical protein